MLLAKEVILAVFMICASFYIIAVVTVLCYSTCSAVFINSRLTKVAFLAEFTSSKDRMAELSLSALRMLCAAVVFSGGYDIAPLEDIR